MYLQYIEEHLKAQERVTAAAMASGIEGNEQRSRMGKNSIASAALSPIRNLGEFYQRKLNKIQGHNVNDSTYLSRSKSPKRRER